MFNQRSTALELMDQPDIPAPDLEKNLQELAFINTWLGGHAVTLHALERIILEDPETRNPAKVWRIADLGSGGGDNLRAIREWTDRHHLQVELTGIDLNPVMINYAQQHTTRYREIQYLQADALVADLPAHSFDIITCCLFCHHFKSESLTQLLSKIRKAASVAVVINDLHRHPLAYYSIKALTSTFSRSYLVKNDAPLSVLRAFSREELEKIFHQAGYEKFSLNWRWAFRWEAILHTSRSACN
jgi:ubiquinone/menaquinone biosynthesis C-methylase UbiE